LSINSVSPYSWNAPSPQQAGIGDASSTGLSIFQQMASDMQAMLAPGQTGAAASGTTASNASGQVASDPVSMLGQGQSSQAHNAGQPSTHHHHHRGADNAAGTTGTGGTTASLTAPASSSAPGLAETFANSFNQILQAYGRQATDTTPSVT
jgi:hypothetical protein